jgi:hypothetical protein
MKAVHAITMSVVIFSMGLGGCGKPKPPMPLDVRFRPSKVFAGYVVILRNTSDTELIVNLTIQRPGSWVTTVLRHGFIEIPAKGVREIGWMEGVQVQQGDETVCVSSDFADGKWTIPYSFDY